MAVRARTHAGLKTTFGVEWGMPLSLAGDVGGRYLRPDGSRPDERRPLLVYLHGYGGNYTEILSRLGATVYRAVHRGLGPWVLSIQGTFTAGGANRTWNGNDSLLPQNTSYPWAQATVYPVGSRRTANGRMYIAVAAGTSAASGTGPSGPGEAIADGSNGLTWRCVAANVRDLDIPDIDRVAGVGRTVGDVFLPRGVVREFIATSGVLVDPERVSLCAYSTGDGLADSVLRHHSDLFTGGLFGLSGCGPTGITDHNYAVPTRRRKRIHWHGTGDVTVAEQGVPPGTSSAAVGNHPSAQETVRVFAAESGNHPALTLIDTGARINFTTGAPNTEVWAPSSGDVYLEGGRPVQWRWYRGVGDGHVPAVTNIGHWTVTNFFDDLPGAL